MGVPLPPISGGSVQPEYAASSINFNRSVLTNKDGFVVPVFTASLAYQRTDYLVDKDGNKTGVINSEIGVPQPDPNRSGYLNLNAEQTAEQFAIVPPNGQEIGKSIADLADELIKADLVKRGILS